jgi:hypothetical protein
MNLMFMMYFIHYILINMFRPLCDHLQGDVFITTIHKLTNVVSCVAVTL